MQAFNQADIAMPLSVVTQHLQRNLKPVLARLVSPRRLGRLATGLPQTINRIALDQVMNRVFAEQIAEGEFDFLQGRQLQLEITDADLFVVLTFTRERLSCLQFSRQTHEVDATLAIDSLSAIQLVQQEVDPDTLFFQRKLKIGGDTELVHQVKNTIDTLDPEVIPALFHKLFQHYRTRILEPSL